MAKYKNDPTDYWQLSSDYCTVDNRVAMKIGLNEAIVLRTIYGLCRTKKQNDNIGWWQGKQSYWLIKFPWLSEKTLQRILAKLEKMKLLEIRIDKKTGNHYRPVQEQIERMLCNDDFWSGQNDLTNDILSGQNDLTENTQSGQNDLVSGQIDLVSGQNDLSLLTLGSSSLSSSLSSNVATAFADAPDDVANDVVDDVADDVTIDVTTDLVVIEPTTEQRVKPSTAETWAVYAYGYERRYGVTPLRNAKVNGQLKQFCERVGYSEAPAIIAFYLAQNDFWYLKQMHTIGIALSEAEKLTAAYRRGSMITKREAEYIDKTSSKKSFIDQILEVRRQKAENGGTQ